MHLPMISELEFHGELPSTGMAENESPPNSKEPKEVRAARKREVRQTPQRKPTTQIWQGKELPICRAFCETTLSKYFLFDVSIVFERKKKKRILSSKISWNAN
jgi:hypothetical protein